MTDEVKKEVAVKKEDPKPTMKYTRFMAFVAFFFGLGYIWVTPEPITAVLIFLGVMIVQWSLGRATITELAKIWKGGK